MENGEREGKRQIGTEKEDVAYKINSGEEGKGKLPIRKY